MAKPRMQNVEAVNRFHHNGVAVKIGDVIAVPAADVPDLEATRMAVPTERAATLSTGPEPERGSYNRRDMRARS